jgi:hypothetical protein
MYVVRILLSETSWMLAGPFMARQSAEQYAERYVRKNPKVGTEVHAVHQPSLL